MTVKTEEILAVKADLVGGVVPANQLPPGGSGDMLRSTYDPNTDGVIAKAQLDASLANTSGTNTGDQTAIPNSDLATMTQKTYKGRTTASTGTPEDVAVATLKSDLTLVKADVGLGSVDNTADTAKPVSTAQQTALDGKVSHSLATAVNDFLVASGASTFVKKTLAEVKAILDWAADIATHAAAADPHTGYQKESEKAQASGYASLGAGGLVPMAQLASGTPDGTKYVRDDGTLVTPPGGSQAFPVGWRFIGVVSTNPATLLGYGTWSAIAAGRILVGLDSGDPDFDTVEEIGGAKTKTIAQANLPNISTGAGTSHNHIQNAHTHDFLPRSATTGSVSSIVTGTLDTSSTISGANQPHIQNQTPTNQPEAAHTHSLGGSGTALNVMNPYFVVYMWKRTA